MPATYRVTNSYGQNLQTIPGVLDPVPLAGVTVTEESNVIAVESVDGLYPRMAVCARGIPYGSFIHAINGLELVLYCSAWDPALGKWTTSAENAEATETVAAGTGHAMGYNPVPVEVRYARGCWMNEISSVNSLPLVIQGSGGSGNTGTINSAPFALVPAYNVGGGSALEQGAPQVHLSDSLASFPVRRHEGEPWGVYVLVCQQGHIASIPGDPRFIIGPSTITAPPTP